MARAKASDTRELDREDRPEQRPEPPRGKAVAYDRHGNPVWRRDTQGQDKYAVPLDMIPSDFTYEWKRYTAYNAVDNSYQASLGRNGWEPVLHSDHNGYFAPPDTPGPVIVDGQILMRRPAILTEEAKREERAAARERVDRLYQQHKSQVPNAVARDSSGRVVSQLNFIDEPDYATMPDGGPNYTRK